MWYSSQSWQWSAATKPGSGITGFWRTMPVKRGKGWASLTSQWVYCPPVATTGTDNYLFLHTRGTVWTVTEWYRMCSYMFMSFCSLFKIIVLISVHFISSQCIMENDLVQCCLVTCCLEITISSNRLPCDFPLLLQILKLPPYHFWRVCFQACQPDLQ